MNRLASSFIAVFSVFILVGCTPNSDPAASTSGTPVRISLSLGSTDAGMLKNSFTDAADSLQIDSAVVVFSRIKFTSRIDSVIVDSTGEDIGEIERELEVTFRGPFVVHVQPQSVVSFANQRLPAGNYDGITLKVHRLIPGERYDDSHEFNGRGRGALDTLAYGASLLVWGKVLKNGEWVAFKFAFDGELQYKLRGNFVVGDNGTIDIALRFDPALWFRDVRSGVLLDPTDPSLRGEIRKAIQRSFMNMRGGRDGNRDGHPDN